MNEFYHLITHPSIKLPFFLLSFPSFFLHIFLSLFIDLLINLYITYHYHLFIISIFLSPLRVCAYVYMYACMYQSCHLSILILFLYKFQTILILQESRGNWLSSIKEFLLERMNRPIAKPEQSNQDPIDIQLRRGLILWISSTELKKAEVHFFWKWLWGSLWNSFCIWIKRLIKNSYHYQHGWASFSELKTQREQHEEGGFYSVSCLFLRASPSHACGLWLGLI